MTPVRWMALGAAMALAMLVAIGVGAVPIAPGAVIHALSGSGDGAIVAIVRDVRLPRVILGAVAGAALAMSGATLQGVLRNPLAEPYLLGVSGGAAVGAVLVSTIGSIAPAAVALGALGGGIAAVLAVLALARAAAARFDARVLLMAGVVVGAFANATIMVSLANSSPNGVRGALWWMMGSLADASWHDDALFVPLMIVAAGVLLVRARDIDALALGEDAAAGLGADVHRSARTLFLASSVLASATVAAAGLIGFVGLVVPALARSIGARRAHALLIASALAGGALLVCADAAARTVRAPTELPVGALTALVGVPFFLVRLGRIR